MVDAITLTTDRPASPSAPIQPSYELEGEDGTSDTERAYALDCVLDPDAADADVRRRRKLLVVVSELLSTCGAYALEDDTIAAAITLAQDPDGDAADPDVAMLADELRAILAAPYHSQASIAEVWRVLGLVRAMAPDQLDEWGHRFIAGME